MKKIIAVILILGLVFSVSILGKDKVEKSGTVSKIEGKMAFVKSNGKWIKLSENTSIYQGSEVKTGKDTKVIITLNDASQLRIAANSQILMEKAMVVSPENRTVITKLVFGRLWAKVSKSGEENRNFEIKVQTASIGVRGTTFDVKYTNKEPSIVSLYTGSVEVQAKKTQNKNDEANKDNRNYDKKQRKEVNGPKEVTLDEYNKVLLKQMQRVTISQTGEIETSDIVEEEDNKDEWVAWNKTLDDTEK